MAEGFSIDLGFNPVLNVEKLNVILNHVKTAMGALGSDIKQIDATKLAADMKKFDTELVQAGKHTDGLKKGFKETETSLSKLKSSIGQGLSIAIGMSGLDLVKNGLTSVVKSGMDYQKSLADMSALTGVTGGALDNLGSKARGLSLQFGGTAVAQINSMKGVLSRFGPDVAKTPAALAEITRSINILGEASGMDAATSMDALTNSMLQFGVDVTNPAQLAKESARFINVLGASAKEGAAEIPQVSEAIVNAGVACQQANVSFEAANAALQVLAAGGKVGAEAGIGLRNVLSKIGSVELMTPDAIKGLKAGGVNMEILTNKALPLQTRLKELQKVQQDGSTVSKLFGIENASSANILISNADKIGEWTKKMTGTNTAFEQAKVNSATLAAQWERLKAKVSDLAVGGFGALKPILSGAMGMFSAIAGNINLLLVPMGLLTTAVALYKGQQIAAFAISVKNNAAMLIGKGIQMASVIATNAATAAQWLWNVALTANPIGIIIMAVAGLVAGIVLLYKNNETVRKAFTAAWTGIKAGFIAVWDVLKKVGAVIWEVGKFIFDWMIAPWKIAYTVIKNLIVGIVDFVSHLKIFQTIGKGVGNAFKLVFATIKYDIGLVGDAFKWVSDKLSNLHATMVGVNAVFGSIMGTLAESMTKLFKLDFTGAKATLIAGFNNIGQVYNDAYNKEIKATQAKEDKKDAIQKKAAGKKPKPSTTTTTTTDASGTTTGGGKGSGSGDSKSDYEIALAQYEEINKIKEDEIALDNQNKINSDKRLGIVKSELQLEQDKLDTAKKATEEIQRQITEFANVKIKAKTADEKSGADEILRKLEIDLAQSEGVSADIKLKIGKINMDTEAELKKLTEELNRKKLEVAVKMGIKPETELLKYDTNALQEKMKGLDKQIADAPDPITKVKLELEQEDIKDQLSELYKKIYDAENAFKAKQKTTILGIKADWIAVGNTIGTLFQNFGANIQFSTNDTKTTELKEQKNKLKLEEDALYESLRKREISQREYYDKLTEIQKEQASVSEELAKQQANILKQIGAGMASALQQTGMQGLDASLVKYQDNSVKILAIDKEIEANKANFAISEAERTAKNDELTNQRMTIATQEKLVLTEAYMNMALVAGGALAELAINGKSSLKTVIIAGLNVLQAMVPIWSAQILGYSLATADSIATLGASALLKWTLLTGVLQGGVSIAKAAVNKFFFKGGPTAKGNPYEAAGIVHKNEFVFDHIMTGLYGKDYEVMHKEKLSPVDYVKKYDPEVLRSMSENTGRKKDQELIQVLTRQNQILEYDNKETRKLLLENIEETKNLKATFSHKTATHVTGSFDIEGDKFRANIEKAKQVSLARG